VEEAGGQSALRRRYSTGRQRLQGDAAQYARRARHYNDAIADCPVLEMRMKTVIIVVLAVVVAGCSGLRSKPYQASDTTASSRPASDAAGPTQRSTQRMFNPDGSLGIYFGT